MPAALELVPGSLGFPALGVKHTIGPAFFSPICSKVPCCSARETLQGALGQQSLSPCPCSNSAIPSHAGSRSVAGQPQALPASPARVRLMLGSARILQPPQTSACSARGPQHRPSAPAGTAQEGSEPL